MSNKKSIIAIIICSTLISCSILMLALSNRYQYANGIVFDKLTGAVKVEANVPKTDDTVYVLGNQAVKIVEKLISGEAGAYESTNRLSSIWAELNNLKIKNKSIVIKTDVGFLRDTISSYGYQYSGTTIEDVKKDLYALTYHLSED